MSTRIPTLRSKEPSLKWNPDPRSRIHEIPQVDRPREKLFAKGPAALSDVELLALVLGSGTRSGGVLEVATRVLAACDDRLDAIEAAALLRIPGLGRARAPRSPRRSSSRAVTWAAVVRPSAPPPTLSPTSSPFAPRSRSSSRVYR